MHARNWSVAAVHRTCMKCMAKVRVVQREFVLHTLSIARWRLTSLGSPSDTLDVSQLDRACVACLLGVADAQ